MWLAQLLVSAALTLTRGQEDPAPLIGTADFENPQAESLTDALNFSNPEVPTVPVGSDLEAAAQDLDKAQAKALAAAPVEGGSPTFAPLAGRPVEAKTLEDYQDDAADAIAGDKDDVARLGLSECGCECCMGTERAVPTHTSNWTCTPVPDYLTPPIELPTDEVAPPPDFGGPSAPATCRGIQASECGSPAHGADKDVALEALTYSEFCSTHCRAVETKTATPCIALEGPQMAAAWHDGTWTDPLVPSVAEEKAMDAFDARLAMAPSPEKALERDQRQLQEAHQTLDQLRPPVAAAEEALRQATA